MASVLGEFICDRCGGTFPKAWTDEQAMAESRVLWGEQAEQDLGVICEVCFGEFMAWLEKEDPVWLTS